MRVLRIAFVLALAVACGGARAESPRCTSRSTSAETQDVTCRLDGTAVAEGLRFKANFAGGHDDTKASLDASVDGVPLTCAEGSKTSLFGEDGEVSLWCDVPPDGPGRRRVLRFTVTWTHAQYLDFEFAGR